jgi:hypothetical protein
MRLVSLILAILIPFIAASAAEIREFNVATLERLGRELSHRDGIAARATDLMLKKYPGARALKMRGWITELRKGGDAVHFIAETPSGPTLAYTATFPQSGEPEVQDMRGQSLPANAAVRYKARNAAVAALQGRLFDINYNFEVLDDPDGRGFLIYALAATQKSDEVILAGHFRVTVSADGTKAERVDALSRSRVSSGPTSDAVALFLIQLVSNKPVETLIYTANLARKPVFVGTPDGKKWMVGEGKMQLIGSRPSEKN